MDCSIGHVAHADVAELREGERGFGDRCPGDGEGELVGEKRAEGVVGGKGGFVVVVLLLIFPCCLLLGFHVAARRRDEPFAIGHADAAHHIHIASAHAMTVLHHALRHQPVYIFLPTDEP